jgi:hypothetical protein
VVFINPHPLNHRCGRPGLHLPLARRADPSRVSRCLLLFPNPQVTPTLKEITMFYSDCITVAAHHAFQNDCDVPLGLLGNTIVSEAAMLAGFDSDRIGCAAWE